MMSRGETQILTKKLPELIATLHKKANYNKKNYYIDPLTGNKVLTSYYLMKRGFCCCTGCRHCPWDEEV